MLLVSHSEEKSLFGNRFMKTLNFNCFGCIWPTPQLIREFHQMSSSVISGLPWKRRCGVQFLISVAANASEPMATLSRGPNNNNHRDAVFPRQGCSSSLRSKMVSRVRVKELVPPPPPVLWWDTDGTSGWHGVSWGWVAWWLSAAAAVCVCHRWTAEAPCFHRKPSPVKRH